MSELHISPTLKRIFLEALILCALALTVGFSINYKILMDAFTGKTVAATQAQQKAPQSVPDAVVIPAYPEMVELEEIDELLAAGALLVDARNIDDFNAGHLPGAISQPFGGIETDISEFKKQVAQQRTLILYCSGFGCPDSFDLGARLLAEGYQQVLVYEGGFPEWRDAGRSVEVGE